jgi:hypothetical protein
MRLVKKYCGKHVVGSQTWLQQCGGGGNVTGGQNRQTVPQDDNAQAKRQIGVLLFNNNSNSNNNQVASSSQSATLGRWNPDEEGSFLIVDTDSIGHEIYCHRRP